MKRFIITIDTEGDNLWAWNGADPIRTENARFLPRFQALCEQYAFKPVWLTNYEMISDPVYVDFVSRAAESGNGEIGMHLHAWNSPPSFDLQKRSEGRAGKPYLIEYPREVMCEKIAYLTGLIRERTGVAPVSHRAGRWATDGRYLDILMDNGYLVDCSATPLVDWRDMPGYTENARGTDYTRVPPAAHFVPHGSRDARILEVPVTIRKTHRFIAPDAPSPRAFLGSVKRAVQARPIWLRPDGHNENRMRWLVKNVAASSAAYLMFMLHSSELMPGGSPLFRTEDQIDDLYRCLRALFDEIAENFTGVTLADFYHEVDGSDADRKGK